MNAKSFQTKGNEMRNVWDSWEWLFREDLERIDTRARKMYSEMQAVVIPKHMVEPFLAEQFRELCQNVASLANEKQEVEPMTPVPSKDKEKAQHTTPSKVITRQLTTEERQRLDALPRQRITNRYGERRREPVVIGSFRRLHDA